MVAQSRRWKKKNYVCFCYRKINRLSLATMSFSSLLTAVACVLLVVFYKLYESESRKLQSVQLEYDNYVKSSKLSQDEQNLLLKEVVELSKKDAFGKQEENRKLIEQLESQLKQYKSKKERLTALEDKLTSETLSLTKKMASKEKEIAELKHELNVSRQHGEKLARDYKFQLNTQIEKVSIENGLKIAELEELVAAAKRETLSQRELLRTIESGKEEVIVELRQSYNQSQKKLKELEHSNDDQIAKNNQLIKKYDQLQKSLEELRPAYKTMHEDYVKVSRDLDDTRQRLIDLKERAELLVHSEENLGKELEKSKDANKELSTELDHKSKELQVYQAFFKKCDIFIEDLKRFDDGFDKLAKQLEQAGTTYEAASSGEDYHSDEGYLSDTKLGEVDQHEFAILTKKASKNTFTLIQRYIEELRSKVAREKSVSSKNVTENADLRNKIVSLKEKLSKAESRNVVVLSAILELRKLIEDELSHSPVDENKLKEVLHAAYQKIEESLKTNSPSKIAQQSENEHKTKDKDVAKQVVGHSSDTVLKPQNSEGNADAKDDEKDDEKDGRDNENVSASAGTETKNHEDGKKGSLVADSDPVQNTKDNDKFGKSHGESTRETVQEKETLSNTQHTDAPTAKSAAPTSNVKQPLASMWTSKDASNANSDVDSDFAPPTPIFKTFKNISSTSSFAPTLNVKENVDSDTKRGTSDQIKKSNETKTKELDGADKRETNEADHYRLAEDGSENSHKNKSAVEEKEPNPHSEASVSNQGAETEDSKSTLEKIDKKLHDDVIAEEKTTQDEKSLAEEEAQDDKEILNRYDLRVAENEGDEEKKPDPSVDPLSEEPERHVDESHMETKESHNVAQPSSQSQLKFDAFKRDIENAKNGGASASGDTINTENTKGAKDNKRSTESDYRSVSEGKFKAFASDIQDAKNSKDSNLIAKSQEGPDREEEPVNGRDNLRLKSHSKDNDHDEEEKGDVKNEHSGSKGVEKQNEPEEQVAMSKAKKDEECKQSYEKDKSEEALRKNEEVKGVEPRIDDATEAGEKAVEVRESSIEHDDVNKNDPTEYDKMSHKHGKSGLEPVSDLKLTKTSKSDTKEDSLAANSLNHTENGPSVSDDGDKIDELEASSKASNNNESVVDTKSNETTVTSASKSVEDAGSSTLKSDKVSQNGAGAQATTVDVDTESIGTETAEKIVQSRKHAEQVAEEGKDDTEQELKPENQGEEKGGDKEANSTNVDKAELAQHVAELDNKGSNRRDTNETMPPSREDDYEEEGKDDEATAQSRSSIESEGTTDVNDTLSLGKEASNDYKSNAGDDNIHDRSTPTPNVNEGPTKTISNLKSNSNSPTKKLELRKTKKKKSKTGF